MLSFGLCPFINIFYREKAGFQFHIRAGNLAVGQGFAAILVACPRRDGLSMVMLRVGRLEAEKATLKPERSSLKDQTGQSGLKHYGDRGGSSSPKELSWHVNCANPERGSILPVRWTARNQNCQNPARVLAAM